MIKAIAIDDEPLALEVIKSLCHAHPSITLEKTFTNLTNAKKYLNKFPVDVVFLDIQMPKTNGIDYYKSLNQEIKVIFTTAFSEYAVEGFNVNATDYLLKPISEIRFAQAIERVTKGNSDEKTHLSIRANYKLNRILLKTILYIEAMDDYIKIHIQNEKTIVARSTMKSILQKLPINQFIRIHKSYIIPTENIKSISKQEVILPYITLPIGSSYKKGLESLH